jgi:hypothetical protein
MKLNDGDDWLDDYRNSPAHQIDELTARAEAAEARVKELEGALGATLDEIEAGPLKEGNFGDYFRSDISYGDVKRRRALLSQPSAKGEEKACPECNGNGVVRVEGSWIECVCWGTGRAD